MRICSGKSSAGAVISQEEIRGACLRTEAGICNCPSAKMQKVYVGACDPTGKHPWGCGVILGKRFAKDTAPLLPLFDFFFIQAFFADP